MKKKINKEENVFISSANTVSSIRGRVGILIYAKRNNTGGGNNSSASKRETH